MSEQNQEKKPKKGFFMFGKKPENYDELTYEDEEKQKEFADKKTKKDMTGI